nr:coiled-coil domain-containing protein 1-like [Leptinotarsa decemlineata]
MDNSKYQMTIEKTDESVFDKVTPELNLVKDEPQEVETFSKSDSGSFIDSYSMDYHDNMENIDKHVKIERDDKIDLCYEDIKTEIVDKGNVTDDIRDDDMTQDSKLVQVADSYSMDYHDDMDNINDGKKIKCEVEIDLVYENIKKEIGKEDNATDDIRDDNMTQDNKLVQVADSYSMDCHDDMDNINDRKKIKCEVEIDLVYENIKKEIVKEDNATDDIRDDNMTQDNKLVQVADLYSMHCHDDMDNINDGKKIKCEVGIDLVYENIKKEIVKEDNATDDIRDDDMTQDNKLVQVADSYSMDCHDDMDNISDGKKIKSEVEIDLVYENIKKEIVEEDNATNICDRDMTPGVKLLCAFYLSTVTESKSQCQHIILYKY